MGIELARHEEVLKRLDRLERMFTEILARDLALNMLKVKYAGPSRYVGVFCLLTQEMTDNGDGWREEARKITSDIFCEGQEQAAA